MTDEKRLHFFGKMPLIMAASCLLSQALLFAGVMTGGAADSQTRGEQAQLFKVLICAVSAAVY